MAKPRIFVSSTFFDLRHIRDRLREFIEDLGFEPVLSEAGSVPYDPSKPPDESCYEEVDRCHILVLIIGGRHGSAASGHTKADNNATDIDQMYTTYSSVTERECERALERGIPVYTLVEKSVLNEYETYKRNRTRKDVIYSAVENVNVFRLIDKLNQRSSNKAVSGFDDFQHISTWLRQQWAGHFAFFLSRAQESAQIEGLAQQIQKLDGLAGAIKQYSESIVELVAKKPGQATAILKNVNKVLDKQSEANFRLSDVAKRLARPKKLTSLEVLDQLRSSQNSDEFFSNLGFDPIEESDGRNTYEHAPLHGGNYLYFSHPDRTFEKLRRLYL